MFYRTTIFHGDKLDCSHALVEADNARAARSLAIGAFISVEKATELELVRAGREGWLIISNASETATDDGQLDISFAGAEGILPAFPELSGRLPEPHAQTADTGEPSPAFKFEGMTHEDGPDVSPGTGEEAVCFTPSTGSAPHWLPTNPVAQNTGD